MRSPRGSMPDSVTEQAFYLIKACSVMRATYQVRLLTYFATQRGARLVLDLKPGCLVHDSLKRFAAQNPQHLHIQWRS